MWDIGAISFEIEDVSTESPVMTIAVTTPDGVIAFMGEPDVADTVLVVRGVHVQGARANLAGAGNLLVLARALMERMGYDGLVVEGAVRTSGARPHHRPRVLRFTRRDRAAPGG
jgi:hypothetical protein